MVVGWGDRWHWNIVWEWDPDNEELLSEATLLVGFLLEVRPNQMEEDVMIRPYGGGNGFSVKSYYERLLLMYEEDGVSETIASSLKIVWKAKVPHKVEVFAWRLLHNRLPTKVQLARRGVEFSDSEKQCNM